MSITCAKVPPDIEVHRVAIHTLCTFRWSLPQETCIDHTEHIDHTVNIDNITQIDHIDHTDHTHL